MKDPAGLFGAQDLFLLGCLIQVPEALGIVRLSAKQSREASRTGEVNDLVLGAQLVWMMQSLPSVGINQTLGEYVMCTGGQEINAAVLTDEVHACKKSKGGALNTLWGLAFH